MAVISTNESNLFGDLASGRLAYPTLQGAVAEAAFMTGMERNSDVVFATACKDYPSICCSTLTYRLDAPRYISSYLAA